MAKVGSAPRIFLTVLYMLSRITKIGEKERAKKAWANTPFFLFCPDLSRWNRERNQVLGVVPDLLEYEIQKSLEFIERCMEVADPA